MIDRPFHVGEIVQHMADGPDGQAGSQLFVPDRFASFFFLQQPVQCFGRLFKLAHRRFVFPKRRLLFFFFHRPYFLQPKRRHHVCSPFPP